MIWTFFSAETISYTSSKSSSSKAVFNISGVSGVLFDGKKTRDYNDDRDPIMPVDAREMITNFRTYNLPTSMAKCKQWAVVTTIHSVTEAVRNIADKPDWCLVVVPDVKTPRQDYYNLNCFYFNEALQAMIFPDMAELIPKNHFGRKNLGYIFAYAMGAERVWDFDDDNDGVIDLDQVYKDGFEAPCRQKGILFNPYKHFGVNEDFCWPRGFPLNHIQDGNVTPSTCQQDINDSDVYVYQSLADMQPDVDGIYRLTKKTPFDFSVPNPRSIIIPSNVYTPFNAQATMWNNAGLQLLFLPCSIHGRVSDIYRSYFTQYIMNHGNPGKRLVFTKPYVVQDRNAHNYLADFNAELPLYERTSVLLEYLSTRPYNYKKSSIRNLLDLYIDLYERDYLEELDITLIKNWTAWIEVISRDNKLF